MAIVKMNKLSVIGMNEEKQDLLRDLMDLGVVEVSGVTDKLQDEEWKDLVVKDGDEEHVSEYDRQLTQIQSALSIIAQYGKIKKPLFAMRRTVSAEDNAKLRKKEDVFEKEEQEVLGLNDRLSEAFATENSCSTQIVSLTPWTAYGLPLEMTETERLKLRLGVVPPVTDVAAIGEDLAGADCASEVTELGRDNEQCYVSLWYFKEDEDKVMDVVKKYGYTGAGIADLKGTVSENIDRMTAKIAELAETKASLEAQIADKAAYKEDLEFYHDMIAVRRDESKVRGNLLTTEQSFTFDGWVPVAVKEKVEKVLSKYTCWHEFAEPTEDDDIPVVLNNNSFVTPMEFITKMYSLPNAREVDPTSIFTFFYIMFFGIMFADIGYGLILFFVTTFAIKKYHLNEGGASQLVKLLSYCGISSAIWGVLFGGCFGDLFSVIAKTFFGSDFAIKPLWLDPVKSSMTFLVFACGFGVVHLFVGMGIKAYEQIKKGKILDAINDNFLWYMIVAGVILWLFGGRISAGAPAIGKWMTIIGLAGAIVLPIFMNKGAGKAIGLWNIYSGVTGNLSDILSYSRLLGLGLASTSIATVINFLATLGGKGFVGILMFVLVEIIGHVFNFAINALGAFVHSCRLQYVEFFGRFFEGGGREFEPFRKDTKYVRIVEEEK